MSNSRLNTKDMFYNASTKTFCIESSELPRTFSPGQKYFMGRYTQAIVLVSHKTGAEKTFVLRGIDRSSEGEINSWCFQSEDGLKAYILND